MLTKVLPAFIEPPGLNLSLAALGGLLMLRWRRLGKGLLWLSLVSLYVLSMPVVSKRLLSGLETYPALESSALRQPGVGAIVVLGGGRYPRAPEYGDDTVSRHSLERLRYAARLHGQTSLPLLLSGGSPLGEDFSEAFLMKEALVDDFRVPVVWTEEHSRTTWENAEYSKPILDRESIGRVFLVTHAWHMARAVDAFKAMGLDPVPAPTGFASASSTSGARLALWLPSARALSDSALALHEHLGLLWYRLRH